MKRKSYLEKIDLNKLNRYELLRLELKIYDELYAQCKDFIDTYLPEEFKSIELIDDSLTETDSPKKIKFIVCSDGRLFGKDQFNSYYQGKIINHSSIILLKSETNWYETIFFEGKLDLNRKVFTGAYWCANFEGEKELKERLFYLNEKKETNNIPIEKQIYDSIKDEKIPLIEFDIGISCMESILAMNQIPMNFENEKVKQIHR